MRSSRHFKVLYKLSKKSNVRHRKKKNGSKFGSIRDETSKNLKYTMYPEFTKSKIIADSTGNDRRGAEDYTNSLLDGCVIESFNLARFILESCRMLKILKPTEIQRKCIPIMLRSNHNYIQNIDRKHFSIISHTGTGKTNCYMWPILHFLAKDMYGIFALILVPARELAIQIAEQFNVYGLAISIRIALCIGGLDITTQSKNIFSRPHILISTPARFSALYEESSSEFSQVFKYLQYLVLDEATQLTDSSFCYDLEMVLKAISSSKSYQTILVSATQIDINKFPSILSELEFEEISCLSDKLYVDRLVQYYIYVPDLMKITYLYYLISQKFPDEQGIIFTNTCRSCQELTTTLELLEVSCTSLHSLLDQKRRSTSLAKFRNNVSRVMISTDLACRGLDIPKVSFVINFNVPKTVEVYLNRIGRTARAARVGNSITFVSFKSDIQRVLEFENHLGTKLRLFELSEEMVIKELNKTASASKKATLFLHRIGFYDLTEMLKAQKSTERFCLNSNNFVKS